MIAFGGLVMLSAPTLHRKKKMVKFLNNIKFLMTDEFHMAISNLILTLRVSKKR